MEEIAIVGLDLAKHVFQVHGADPAGAVVVRKKLRREQLIGFFANLPSCTVAMEACGGAHYWAREIGRLGHEVRLIAPAYVKPFVKRQKNDMADAEAICEAAQRPSMRFVAVKSEAAQASALVFRARDLLVRQRTQLINALRGHMTEFGIVVAQGPMHVGKLVAVVSDPASDLPEPARLALGIIIAQLQALEEQVRKLDAEIVQRAKQDPVARRLMTIPGIGAITATAFTALVPAAATFRRGRDFAAWLGLTPAQRSSGGKERLGRITRMGERTLRRLLIIGASTVASWASRKGPSPGSWLAQMLSRKPPMLVRVALANKMARTVWALLVHGGVYRAPAVAA
jgi:transposase